MLLFYASWISDATLKKKIKLSQKIVIGDKYINKMGESSQCVYTTYTLSIFTTCQLYLNKAGKKSAMGGSKKK